MNKKELNERIGELEKELEEKQAIINEARDLLKPIDEYTGKFKLGLILGKLYGLMVNKVDVNHIHTFKRENLFDCTGPKCPCGKSLDDCDKTMCIT